MGQKNTLATDKRQLTLIYNSQSSIGQQTLGYVQAANKKIQTVDISKTSLGNTAWVGIAEGLKMPLKKLFDPGQSGMPDIELSAFDTDDWLKLLNKNPGLLQHPIAINGDRYLRIKTPSEILQFFEVDSAGLKKPRLGDKQEVKPGVKSDRFI